MKNWMKITLLVLAVIAIGLLIMFSSNDGFDKIAEKNSTDGGTKDMIENNGKNPIATITMETGELINIELYPQKAPNTVNNFIALANDGFYDGVILHRVIEGFVLQGGDPNGTGMGGPGYSIAGEFTANGFTDNDITHNTGVISMARSRAMDSAGSQFFLVVGDAKFLDDDYAGFGMMSDEDSINTCLKFAKVKTNGSDKPLVDLVIKTVTIDTQGNTYPAPIKVG